ncbi:hypothetical protein BKA63DRAFT_311284 [Paraphoma chrysanthemicola]|nr:hypothetical protein BKA63DRAFT_311284 [Paraphoma chrysanthemicola]
MPHGQIDDQAQSPIILSESDSDSNSDSDSTWINEADNDSLIENAADQSEEGLSDNSSTLNLSEDEMAIDTSGTGNLVRSSGASGNAVFFPLGDLNPANYRSAAITQYPDGRIEGSAKFNDAKCECQYCAKSFPNRQQKDDHIRDYTRTCSQATCTREVVCCISGGLQSFAETPYCLFTCVKHRVCFDTPDEAQDHAAEKEHAWCYYPRCGSAMARRSPGFSNNEVKTHVNDYHHHGKQV